MGIARRSPCWIGGFLVLCVFVALCGRQWRPANVEAATSADDMLRTVIAGARHREGQTVMLQGEMTVSHTYSSEYLSLPGVDVLELTQGTQYPARISWTRTPTKMMSLRAWPVAAPGAGPNMTNAGGDIPDAGRIDAVPARADAGQLWFTISAYDETKGQLEVWRRWPEGSALIQWAVYPSVRPDQMYPFYEYEMGFALWFWEMPLSEYFSLMQSTADNRLEFVREERVGQWDAVLVQSTSIIQKRDREGDVTIQNRFWIAPQLGFAVVRLEERIVTPPAGTIKVRDFTDFEEVAQGVWLARNATRTDFADPAARTAGPSRVIATTTMTLLDARVGQDADVQLRAP